MDSHVYGWNMFCFGKHMSHMNLVVESLLFQQNKYTHTQDIFYLLPLLSPFFQVHFVKIHYYWEKCSIKMWLPWHYTLSFLNNISTMWTFYILSVNFWAYPHCFTALWAFNNLSIFAMTTWFCRYSHSYSPLSNNNLFLGSFAQISWYWPYPHFRTKLIQIWIHFMRPNQLFFPWLTCWKCHFNFTSSIIRHVQDTINQCYCTLSMYAQLIRRSVRHS